MILDFVANFILPPVIEALGGEAISRAYRWCTASDSSDHEAQLTSLRDSLKIIQSMIHDAERKQGKESDDPVRLWLQRLQRLAYDVEDVLDECDYEHFRRHVETLEEKKRKRSSFTSDIVDKIKDINMRFDELKERARVLNLESREFHPTAMQLPKTDSVLGDSKVFGRGDDIERILGILDDLREKQYLVSGVSIVGMGGLGKTTVARSIYKKAKEEKRYDLVAWVCVSEDFNEETILREMHEHFIKDGVPPRGINVLVEGLAKELEKKNFLLVLDDVWNKDQSRWNDFSNRLSRILKTTRNSIVMTTRDKEVASVLMEMNLMQNSMQIYEMHELSDDECWLIIEETILTSSKQISISSNLKNIGVEIAKKCGGLPLAATIIGGTLSRESQTSEWEAIRDNDAWNLNSKDGERILSILRISFDHLPPPLKKCFSYCSIFPKDFLIEKDDLVQLWMAQGYLQQPNEKSMTMEDIGDAYFNYLLSNSLFQDVRRMSYGDIIYCKMHDVVHDLALAISKDETFTLKAGCKIDENASILHLRVKHDASESLDIPPNILRRLRSLFIEEKVGTVFNAMAFNLKSLRSLKLAGTKHPWHGDRVEDKKELCPALGQLKHLRYFDISIRSGYVLPESFCKLYNLQTFRLYTSWELLWPQHKITNLVSLRHICFHSFDGYPILGRIGHLTSLRTLPVFSVGIEDGGGIEELGGLLQLRGELKIRGLEHVHSSSEATKANLKEKPGIRQLELQWINSRERCNANEEEEVLEGLQPHSNLKSLSIDYYMGKSFPSWMMSGGATFLSNNLVRLQLKHWHNCEHIPSLGLLPSLKSLCISSFKNVKRMGHKFDTTKSNSPGGVESIKLFPALRQLELYNLVSLEEWIEVDVDIAAGGKVESVFPYLEFLEIDYCPQLEIWQMGGFSSRHKLSHLRISNCNKLMAIPNMNGLSSLQFFSIEKCFNLQGIPEEFLRCLTSLKKLEMGDFFDELEEFPGLSCIHQLNSSLESLILHGWDRVKSLSDQLQHLTALKELTLSNFNQVEAFPEGLGNLTSLQRLHIFKCRNLKHLFPLQALKSLIELRMGPFSSDLEEFPGLDCIIHLHASLKDLKLTGWDKIKFLPNQLRYLTALKSLTIEEFNRVEVLPDWLGNLSSLQYLHIIECPNLKKRCIKYIEGKKYAGEEWSKISHIPDISIDWETISIDWETIK
ncbi:hypothetical protein SLA2020_079860 [Shorea laevis]